MMLGLLVIGVGFAAGLCLFALAVLDLVRARRDERSGVPARVRREALLRLQAEDEFLRGWRS